ncbi:MAG: MBL fold metallo-hydrolase [Lapillicoccus sp.]
MEVTGIAQRDAWRDHMLPPVERVRDGLWSVPLPNRHSGIRYVLCYLVELDEGLAVVDPGWNDDESWSALEAGLKALGRRPAEVRSIVVTHSHPDHLGGARRLRAESGAPLLVHEAEAPLIAEEPGDPTRLIARTAPWLARHGSSAEEIASFYSDRAELVAFSDMPRPDAYLVDGEQLPWPGREVYAMHTPGHTPGHLCLHAPADRLLLTGDHLLPRITPTVSAFPGSGRNPLASYLDSLAKSVSVDVDEVLPAHEYRFSGLQDRVATVLHHHEERETEVFTLLGDAGEPLTAQQLSPRLTWSRPWEEIQPAMRRAALAETVAHLVLLESRGALRQVADPTVGSAEPDADPVIRWEPVTSG